MSVLSTNSAIIIIKDNVHDVGESSSVHNSLAKPMVAPCPALLWLLSELFPFVLPLFYAAW